MKILEKRTKNKKSYKKPYNIIYYWERHKMRKKLSIKIFINQLKNRIMKDFKASAADLKKQFDKEKTS